MMDWPAAWARLRQLEGDARDAEAERLDVLWQAEYVAAFVAYALSRPGWDRDNAETWAHEIVDDALTTYRGAAALAEAAQIDVRNCEWETAQAE